MLPGLSPCVESTGNLGAAKGAVGKLATVFTGKGNSLRDALVDDVAADLGETVDIGLAGPEVAPLDRVVEETPDAVAVVLVVLGGIDASLRRDAVGAACAILKAEAIDLIAELGKRGRRRGTGKPRSDNDDFEFPLVGRIDQLCVVFEIGPLLLDGTGWNFGIKDHDLRWSAVSGRVCRLRVDYGGFPKARRAGWRHTRRRGPRR